MRTILLTGVGAPGTAGTIKCLRENPDNKKFRIIGTDIQKDPVGETMCDDFIQVFPPSRKVYGKQIVQICEKEKVDVILPQTTRELKPLASLQDHLCTPPAVVSSLDTLKIANDKYALALFAAQRGVAVVPNGKVATNESDLISAIYDLGYPEKNVVIKPLESNGMRGFRIIDATEKCFDDMVSEKPDGTRIDISELIQTILGQDISPMLVSEYLPGTEYTVDCFRGKNGTVAIPRIRQTVRSGITFETEVVEHRELSRSSIALAEALDLKYAFGFQFKEDEYGVPKLLEGNPRVQGTMEVAMHAGFNIIYAAVIEALGTPVDLSGVKIKYGTKFKRFWGGVAI